LDDDIYQQSAFYDEKWIAGTFFDHYSHYIMGTVIEGAGQWNSDIIKGEITEEELEKIITLFEPLPRPNTGYFIALRDHVPLPDNNQKKETVLLQPGEAEAVALKTLKPGATKSIDGKTYILSDTFQWVLGKEGESGLQTRLERIKEIGSTVGLIRAAMRNNERPETLQIQARAFLEQYKGLFGNYPHEDTLVKRFLNERPAVSGIYEGLLPIDADILNKESIYTAIDRVVNGHNPAIQALLVMQNNMAEGSDEAVTRYFPDTAEALIAEMYVNKDIFRTPDGIWQLREDFIADNAWNKIDALRAAVKETSGDTLKAKLEYGIAELEKAIGWVPIEEADFSPHSSWISEALINAWVKDEDGLDAGYSFGDMELSKNSEGKWGVRFSREKEIRGQRWDDVRKVPKGEWTEYADPVIYYLNMQKQRSRNYDTESYNREHNENFRNYIANHKEFRTELETKYNRLFNTELSAPTKTYPVSISGWREVKTIRPHQWQTIHHLYRNGKGLSALGTGFGKTLSGIGLISLLRQEGKIKRVWLQVPNNKVKDWVAEITDVMPGLRLAFVDPETPGYSSQEKRYGMYQRIANTQADIIIMPESAASEIQLTEEHDKHITAGVVAAQLTEKGEGKSARRRARIAGGAENQLANGKTNKTVRFEDFGCDALFVDEAHRYKNLFMSSLSRETGMNDGRQSAKAMSLFKKASYIRTENNGCNVFLFTATPLTNSPLEYYNMLMYIAPEELRQFGISTIDGFIKNFAAIETGWKYDWATGEVKQGKILTGFRNLRTLQDLFFKYTDLQNDPEAINLDKPDAVNRPNVIPMNTEQTLVLKAISEELENFKTLDKEGREEFYPGRNFLTFYSQMRTASLDLELYDPQTYKNWENPKLSALAKNAYENFKATKGGQVVFCDRVLSGDGSFNIHEKIQKELEKEGFKDYEIIIVNGFTKGGGVKSDSAIEKEVSAAVAAYNSGKYKVLIGSTACIGEGLNLQENSAALHHFDIPFRPSDFIQRNGRIDRQGNSQNLVELHTYLAAGTIDNYSVGLVQGKANWIDQLLKTKSNVFTNPLDENGMDADELLMALTEEWGDAEKAEERREELEKKKAEKIYEAQDTQRKNHLQSLALMRCAITGFTGDKGTIQYQNRIQKIHALESALKNNPTFHNHVILGANTLFLYSKAADRIFMKNDMLIYDERCYEVTQLNFKKQECVFTRILTDEDEEKKKKGIYQGHYYDTVEKNVASIDPKDIKESFPKPSKELREMIKELPTPNFYKLEEEVKEKYYTLHLECALRNSFKPVYFTLGEDGILTINLSQYYGSNDLSTACNPFSRDGKEKITKALTKGITFEHEYYKDECVETFALTFPELYTLVKKQLDKLEVNEIKAEYKNIFQDAGSATEGQYPWKRTWEPGMLPPPYNPVTGEKYSGLALLSCMTGYAHEDRDSRFFSPKEIRCFGFSVKAGAFPVPVRISGAGKDKYTLLYNAGEINGLPVEESIHPVGSRFLSARGGTTLHEKFAFELAAFFRAVRSGAGYHPHEGTTTEDYARLIKQEPEVFVRIVERAAVVSRTLERGQRREAKYVLERES
jgi:hypothetical protein